ncbi:MAG TPA: cell division protein FtsX, partial [Sulfitobacter sp.]|nr:cell division protein FtsX [Sulfitobacter sp.]
MKMLRIALTALWNGDRQADRVVPPSGFTAQLTLFAAGTMAFLAVFALALSLASGRLANIWGQELARTATIRVVAPIDQRSAQTEAALRILETTKGVATARALTDEEQQSLLAPWFGPELAIDALPVPRLIEIVEEDDGMDADGLRLRLAAEVPGAVLDNHS